MSIRYRNQKILANTQANHQLVHAGKLCLYARKLREFTRRVILRTRVARNPVFRKNRVSLRSFL
jgi:hypothetical protein